MNLPGQYLFCVTPTHTFTFRWNTLHVQQCAYHIHNGNTWTVYMSQRWITRPRLVRSTCVQWWVVYSLIRGFHGQKANHEIRWPQKIRVYSWSSRKLPFKCKKIARKLPFLIKNCQKMQKLSKISKWQLFKNIFEVSNTLKKILISKFFL